MVQAIDAEVRLSHGNLADREPTGETVFLTRTSFEDFYRREFRPVVALVYALSGSRTGAEDLAQEAFVAAHRRWSRICEYEKPEAWVRRVAANLAISAFRRRMAEARALARVARLRDQMLPPVEPEDDGFWKMVRNLPARQAQAVTLFYLEDRPVSEIALILGCSPATARVHLHRARLSLARRLEGEKGS
jgi:RNA polymerase sigma-70 factor (ECF subfamily)